MHHKIVMPRVVVPLRRHGISQNKTLSAYRLPPIDSFKLNQTCMHTHRCAGKQTYGIGVPARNVEAITKKRFVPPIRLPRIGPLCEKGKMPEAKRTKGPINKIYFSNGTHQMLLYNDVVSAVGSEIGG